MKTSKLIQNNKWKTKTQSRIGLDLIGSAIDGRGWSHGGSQFLGN